MTDLKRIVPVGDQWPTLLHMTDLVTSGHLAFPRQVAAELKVARHPDAPGAWAAHVKGWAVHRQPTDDHVAEVLGVAPLLVDATAEADPADPYIVAMALQITEKYPSVRVVIATEDRKDRLPLKESILTACGRLGLTCCTSRELFEWLRGGMA